MNETHIKKNDVVKCTVMLADIADFGEFNKVYSNFFAKLYPARSTFAVSGLALNAKIEIECITAKN
ncbi:RidA family protein [Pseudocolwellia agarivorans]|uniref:RidA family protein n=1 Tax=Pseudocolwellia agarivorans TaxID=1911682 RepID=UPI00098755BB|nr:Rid family hydrolase [Pseudocolwellia agarivorans]